MITTRDNNIDILKGIGILMVVMGHSGCPANLRTIIYMIHMPLFFLASGYFLKEKRLLDFPQFMRGKIRTLYVPFIKYSIAFLLLHNLLIDAGVMSTEYGAEYYSPDMMFLRLVLRLVFMEVYTEQLLGTYWFLQALFFCYVLLSLSHSLASRFTKKPMGNIIFSLTLFLALLVSTLHLLFPGFKTVCIYRICMGAAFVWIGHLLSKRVVTTRLLLLSTLLLTGIFFLHPASMKEQSDSIDFLSLIVSGTCGFIVLHKVSWLINKTKGVIPNCISRVLAYMGRESFYIMTFHILAFKIVSFIIVLCSGGEDYALVGTHPCIKVNGSLWWIAYSVIGVTASLAISKFISSKRKLFVKQ
ncbi:MAG: acyltransferase family protein [Bacteroidaceae bacterium]